MYEEDEFQYLNVGFEFNFFNKNGDLSVVYLLNPNGEIEEGEFFVQCFCVSLDRLLKWMGIHYRLLPQYTVENVCFQCLPQLHKIVSNNNFFLLSPDILLSTSIQRLDEIPGNND